MDKLEPLGKDRAVPGLDLVGDEEKERCIFSLVCGIHEDRALAHQIAVLLQHDVADGEHERMPWMNHLGESNPGPIKRADGFLGEADPLVTSQHRRKLPAVAPADLAVTLADERGNMGDLEAARFTGIHRATQSLEGLGEKGTDEKRLEAAGFGHFHLFLHGKQPLGTHGFLGEGVAFEEFLDVAAVEGGIDALRQAGTDFGLVVVADGIQQQILKTLVFEDFAQNIEDAAIECFVDGFQLGEQAVIDFALAGFLGDEVPKMANLLLADAVDTPEALFEAVRVPWKVIIDHEIGVLEVHSFPGGIGGEEDADFRIGPEKCLALPALVTVGAAVNGRDGLGRAENAGDPPLQIVQRVPMLGEDDHLALAAIGIAHVGIVLEDLRKFIPLPVLPGVHHSKSLLGEVTKEDDFHFEFGDGFRRRGGVGQFFLQRFLFLGAEVVVVFRRNFQILGFELFST